MDLIYGHKSGGELWQGDAEDVKSLLRRGAGKISVIGLFADEFQPDDQSGIRDYPPD